MFVQVVQRFQELFAQTKYKEAAELAAESPQGILRTPDTVAKILYPKTAECSCASWANSTTVAVLWTFGTLLTRGKLNAFESLELSRLVVNQNKMNLLENWLAEDKLECSEELGDLVKVGYNPDYFFLLQTILGTDPQGAVNFALMMSQMEGGCPVDYNTITDLFLQRNLIREATAFLLDVLKPNLPEHAFLQTKVLEINLVTFPNVADAILANGMFSHYDRPRIAQLCEKAGLYVRALQHYTELPDIKRVIVNAHAIEPQSLVEFFGTLSREWALECMKDLLLVNLSGNLQIIVQFAKEYCEQIVEFAFRVEEDAVWSQAAKAQLREGLVSDAIESFIHADDATQFLDVIRASEDADVYPDLVRYLLMVRQKVKEPKVDSELIYAYAKIDRLGEIEEFILMPNGAVDAARKANSSKTWKEVCFACVDAEEF
ncbi:hypothetical protein GQ457_07G017970 [Hibiscus cannabinus]